ncbi:hypothetical protein TrLO_g1437 [Triparma laevis f. longispina]|uniref:Uncharacterized protein n=1 Tax=Triparma laevis f. longispina TaxID=1714387 RepID=A0A9W7KYS1_9STRA|nr:hypothetical protein TrLO_g1437 [Triparma laevis f. longispina]
MLMGGTTQSPTSTPSVHHSSQFLETEGFICHIVPYIPFDALRKPFLISWMWLKVTLWYMKELSSSDKFRGTLMLHDNVVKVKPEGGWPDSKELSKSVTSVVFLLNVTSGGSPITAGFSSPSTSRRASISSKMALFTAAPAS